MTSTAIQPEPIINVDGFTGLRAEWTVTEEDAEVGGPELVTLADALELLAEQLRHIADEGGYLGTGLEDTDFVPVGFNLLTLELPIVSLDAIKPFTPKPKPTPRQRYLSALDAKDAELAREIRSGIGEGTFGDDE